MGRSMLVWPAVITAMLVACDDGPTEVPDNTPPAPPGVDFGLAEGTFGAHHADGRPASGEVPLDGEFAVALPDSLGGLVLVSYDSGTRDLFILQVNDAAAGTYACGPVTAGSPCHARYFENVREDEGGVVRVEGRLDLVSGSLEVSAVGPDQVEGAFQGDFERTAGDGDSGFAVTRGTVDVDLLDGSLDNGGLTCLIRLTTGATDCSG